MTLGWEKCEYFGWYLRLCAHREGEVVGIVSQVNKTKWIITKADWNTKRHCFMEINALIFLRMFSELMYIQIGWNITPQTIKDPFKFCSASYTLVGFLWCHLSNFVPFSNTFVKIYQSHTEKKFQTHEVSLLALKKTGRNDTLFNQA